MGRFEIILILIGVVWTIVSAVAQKKAKAAKLAAMEVEDDEFSTLVDDDFVDPALEVSVEDPVQVDPLARLRSKRLERLRSRVDGMRPSNVVASGTSIKVPRKASGPPPPIPAEDPFSDKHEEAFVDQLPPIDEHGHERASPRDILRGELMGSAIRDVIGDRQRIREAILMKEVLGPPLSIRNASRS